MKVSRRGFIEGCAAAAVTVAAASRVSAAVASVGRSRLSLGAWASLGDAALLAEAGYSYLEVKVADSLVPTQSESVFETHLTAARASPLPMRVSNMFLPRDLQCVGPDASPASVLSFARTAFSRAQRAGVETIVLGSPRSRRIPEGYSRAAAQTQFVDVCKQLAILAERHGVLIVLEPLNRSECNWINSLAQGAEIVTAVAHPNLQLMADLYHMKTEQEPAEQLWRYRQMLRHAHIAEVNGRSAPGTHGEDFTAYLHALRDSNYSGLLTVECLWQDIRSQAAEAFATVTRQLALQ